MVVITKLVMKMSNWNRLRRVLAWVLLAVNIFKTKRRLRNASRIDLTVEQVQNAERLILRRGQAMSFDEEFKRLRVKNAVRESSKLYSLDPFIDSDGIIRVGGRIQNSSLDFNCIHPVVLSKNDRVSQLIIEYSHMKVAHGGRSATINEVRNEGFWIISINALARKILYYCVMCRCLRGRVGKQIMAKLPKERLVEAPPFTYCGVDCFGSFVIKERRKELKRYGVLFTCFSCRAVHIEIANSLETDTFILALRRFIGRRGNVRYIRSDNGGNFVGANRELRQAFAEMDHERIKIWLNELGGDWVWDFNPPSASHMGGVWERQIRSARNVLTCLMKTHSASLDDESL